MAELRSARLARGWSQAQVIDELVRQAAAAHEHVATRPSLKTLLSRWENGHAVPDPHYRRLLAQVFGQSVLGLPLDESNEEGEGRFAADGRSTGADAVLIPVVADGGIRYVSIRRREMLAAGIGTALGVAPGDAESLRGQENRLRVFSDTVARRLGPHRLTVADPALEDLTLRVAGGDEFSGTSVPITLGPAGRRVGDEILVELHREEAAKSMRSTPSRIFVTDALDHPDRFYMLGGRAVVRQLRSSRRCLRIPSSYLLDDLTLGILWGAASFDQPLLDDDALLARRQANPVYRSFAVAPEVSDDLTADLSPVSRMWMGSDYCARYIVNNLSSLRRAPQFWTRERRGRKACTWLFFSHKLTYLRRAHERSRSNGRSTMTRSFCIPEKVNQESPVWERSLLFLSIALMESLGVEVRVCTEPDLEDVDGVVIAPDSRALVANWVRAGNAWVTERTTDSKLLRSYQDRIDFSVQASVNAGEDPQQRLQSLCAYLGLGWHRLGLRCCELTAQSPRGIYEPRSRLLSFAGLERALAFVQSFHRRCNCQRQQAAEYPEGS